MQKYEWSEKALSIHSLIYIFVGGELRIQGISDHRKRLLKQALALVGKLDWLSMDLDESSSLYKEHYLALFLILKQVNLDRLLKKKITEKWGEDCFVVEGLQKGESLCV
jgi:hypothetical protein